MSFTGLLPKIIGMAGVALCTVCSRAFAQAQPKVDHELWVYSYNYFKINDKSTFNQDGAYLQSLEDQSKKQFFLRSQFNYSLNSVVSLHGGLSFYFKDNGPSPNSQEIRPWQGVKWRWPSVWKMDFTSYARLEERFVHQPADTPWSTLVRIRYELSTDLPINKAALTDNTLFLSMAYQIVGSSFNQEFSQNPVDYQRFEVGPGYEFNVKSRLKALLVLVNYANPHSDGPYISNMALQIKYYRYFNF